MRAPSGLRANLLLAGATALAVLLLAAVVWEVRGNIRYQRWRRSFDDAGWLTRLTIPSADETLLWEYRPYGQAEGIATNRFGFRERDDVTLAKRAGIRRVAFVGDSVTLGMGVDAAHTFAHRVGELAAAAGKPIEPLNFGVDGYHALQVHQLVATKVLPFAPDDVVYVLCMNDFDFTDSSGRKISYFRKPRLFLLQDVERALRAVRGTEFHRHHFQKHAGEVLPAIADMRRLVEARGGRFLLAITPVLRDKDGRAVAFDDTYPLADLHAAIVRFCSEHGIAVHDLRDDLRRQPPPPARYGIDLWHLSDAGHEAVAQALSQRLLAP